ncbi:AraC family transcriptional regulator [Pseudomonas sp. NPDC090208]|uniref:AraC family transcriptional regulator n=1 Tax=Pseudomonas sp. NPDC090208 TaxID=3364478 RepID=UPI00381585C9
MSNADHWLKYLTAEGVVVAQSRVKGDWGIEMEQREGTYFHFLAQGTAYFSLDGQPQIKLQPGDVVVLPQGATHQLRSAPQSKVASFADFVRNIQALYSKEPDATIVVCGSFGIDRYMVMPAIKSLPPSIHLQAESNGATAPIAELLKQLRSEVENARMGGKMVVRNLLSTLFIYILRQWSESETAEAGSWFFAMQNRHIAKALACIHQKPGNDWSLDNLAREAGLSRSLFAQQFRESVGETPYGYLTRWRLGIAAQLLAQTDLSIEQIAQKVGYRSEYSFNRAFKKARGRTPTKERERRLSPENGPPIAIV